MYVADNTYIIIIIVILLQTKYSTVAHFIRSMALTRAIFSRYHLLLYNDKEHTLLTFGLHLLNTCFLTH